MSRGGKSLGPEAGRVQRSQTYCSGLSSALAQDFLWPGKIRLLSKVLTSRLGGQVHVSPVHSA